MTANPSIALTDQPNAADARYIDEGLAVYNLPVGHSMFFLQKRLAPL